MIQDLSADGISLQLDREFRVQPDNLLISLKSPDIAVLPTQARVRVVSPPARKRFEKPLGFLCGCIFLSPTEAWAEWYKQAVERQVAGRGTTGWSLTIPPSAVGRRRPSAPVSRRTNQVAAAVMQLSGYLTDLAFADLQPGTRGVRSSA